MLKKLKVLTAFVTAVSLAAASLCPVFAREEDALEEQITVEEAADNSLIYYYNMHRLRNQGEMSNISESDNGLRESGGVFYTELAAAQDYLGVTYKWDGASSSVILDDGEDSCAVKCVDLSEVEEEGTVGFFMGEYLYIPVKVIAEGMGWHYYQNSDLWAVSKKTPIDELFGKEKDAELLNLGKTTVIDLDFEEEKPEFKKGYWNGASEGSFAKPIGVVTEEGNSYLQIGASTAGYGGPYIPPVEFLPNTKIQLEFDVTKSEDFEGASFSVLIQGFYNGAFKTYIDGVYQTPTDAGKWVHITKELDSSQIPEGISDIRYVFTTTNKAAKTAGAIKVDNIVVRTYPVPVSNEITPEITADKLGNWYILGETITMAPKNKLDTEQYKSVGIEIYDSWDNIVHKESISAKQFNEGYKWTPDKQGFYEYKFYTTDNYGRTQELNDFYTGTNPNTKEKVKIYLKRQGVVVARYKTKPMEERSPRLAVSVEAGRYLNPEIANGRKNGLQGNQIALADILGFSTIRFHWLSPDGLAYKTQSRANVRRGVFDFAEWDLSVNDATERGFDLILNLLGTPRYAVPYRTGYTTPTGKGINYYAPVDINAWRAYVDYAVNRYKDVCHIWEIWNEPHVYGGSVFWQGITEDFAKIQKAGYEAVKKYQPGDESIVLLGGIGARRYTNFYEELVQTDAYDYYDMLAMHGWDVDPWTYNKIAEDYGKEAKPICSTEMHMMLRASDSEYLNNTEKEEAMRCIVEFLKDFKYGAKFTTFFAVNLQSNIEWLKYLNENKIYGQGMDGGAYKVGISQPRFAAIAMNTFFDTMGKQYDYVDEYLLANKKQNVVRVNNNGKDQLIVWNVGGSKSNTTILSKQITDCAGEDFRIVDWENNDVDISDLENISIKPETMYFISGLNSEKLDEIESAQGEELYTGKVLYNNTEKQKTDTGNILNHVITNGTTSALFDKNSFELSKDIVYTEDNWRWRAVEDGAKQEDFGAKYALSVTDEGMYLVVKVNDATDNAIAGSPAQMNLKDSIQFAFDTVGDRSDNGYMECYAGLNSTGTPTVYKKTAPYIGGDIISDFTPGDTVIKNAVFNRTANGSEITYMIFLPTREIYPYEKNVYEAMHFSLAINQNNGEKNIGRLEWGAGLGEVRSPLKFGDVWLDAEVAKNSGVYYPPLGIGCDKPIFDLETLEYTEDINWISDNMNWVPLAGDDPNFKAKFAVGMTEEGMYLAAEVEDDELFMEASSGGGLWNRDSMQFAMDLSLRGASEDRIEAQCGKVTGMGDTIYKEAAPFVSTEKTPEGYTQAKNVISGGVKNITAEDGKIVYKLFIPASEFYQFNIAENDCIKLSLLFNQYKDGKRLGYLEWSSGIGGSKNAKQYGIVSYR